MQMSSKSVVGTFVRSSCSILARAISNAATPNAWSGIIRIFGEPVILMTESVSAPCGVEAFTSSLVVMGANAVST